MNSKKFREHFIRVYGSEKNILRKQKKRFSELKMKYIALFNSEPEVFISAPARVELCGNHTDHNGGRVVAAAINLDMIALAGANQSQDVVVYSEGFSEPFKLNLDEKGPFNNERATTTGLLRGIGTRLDDMGQTVKGFNAVIQSDIPISAGLSSSASVEILIGSIFNMLFNDGMIPAESLAMVSQFAENSYFGKPCGLMDQMTCAVGGIIQMEFKDPTIPLINRIDFNLKRYNYSFVVVNTGISDVSLRDEYKSIPDEMKLVAKQFGLSNCSQLNRNDIISNFKELRQRTGDRALARALHFIEENDRVYTQTKALGRGDFQYFLDFVNESGNSSYKWLQNVYSSANSKNQGIALALALTEDYLNKIQAGACRVHGGGFAGTVLTILPDECVEEYVDIMKPVFTRKNIYVQVVRDKGTASLRL
jgi:galactokinase